MPRNPGLPHYRRIANAIIASIQGKSSIGRAVPSETAVARKYGVAKTTAQRALDELRLLGYVTRLRGSGTYSTGPTVKTVYVIAYELSSPPLVTMFKWLEHLLGRRGYRLVVVDTGLRGERMRENFRLVEVRRAEAVIWLAPSHPLGVRAAIAARRKLPKRMPLLLIADPLGLSLQGRHRIDLVHWDYAEAIQRILAQCDREGFRHPVLVSRNDVTLYATDEAERSFLADLTSRGVKTPASHVLSWDAFHSKPGEKFVRHLHTLRWKPDAYVLQYWWSEEFRAACAAGGMDAPDPKSTWIFGSNQPKRGLKMDFREMAEVCTDLLLNRLGNLNRPNLRVAINVPVRRSPDAARRAGVVID